jgi:CBS domain-containing protein
VIDGERVEGIVTMHHIKNVAKDLWSKTTIAEIMIPLAELKCVEPDAKLADAFQQLTDVNQLPVLKEDRLVGLLSREHVMEFLRMRAELNLE